jgi:hypothetical protein
MIRLAFVTRAAPQPSSGPEAKTRAQMLLTEGAGKGLGEVLVCLGFPPCLPVGGSGRELLRPALSVGVMDRGDPLGLRFPRSTDRPRKDLPARDREHRDNAWSRLEHHGESLVHGLGTLCVRQGVGGFD